MLAVIQYYLSGTYVDLCTEAAESDRYNVNKPHAKYAYL